MKEEARSARIGMQEDLEDMRREEEEKARKKKMMKAKQSRRWSEQVVIDQAKSDLFFFLCEKFNAESQPIDPWKTIVVKKCVALSLSIFSSIFAHKS